MRAVTTAVLCSLAIAVSADDASDKMKGIGEPIFYMIIFAAIVAFTHKTLISAHQNFTGDPQLAWAFRCSVASAVLSILLLWTPAWNYALVSLIMALVMAFVCNAENFAEMSGHVVTASVVWFLILVGIPDRLSAGIITTVSLANCNNFYNTYNGVMCANGWVVVTEILATLHIGFSMVSMLTIAGAKMGKPMGGPTGSIQESLMTGAEKAAA